MPHDLPLLTHMKGCCCSCSLKPTLWVLLRLRDQCATGKEGAIFGEVTCVSLDSFLVFLGEICPWEKLSDLYAVLEGREDNHCFFFFPLIICELPLSNCFEFNFFSSLFVLENANRGY